MILGLIKLLLVVLWILLNIPLLWLCVKLKKFQLRNRIFSFGCLVVLQIIGIQIKMEGLLEKNRPLLLVSNHLSYLDILVLGAKTPVRFTPKSDMESWPLFSLMCRLSGSIYVERKANKIKDASKIITEALEAGEIVSLFPEGTTGDGRHLLPFKSSLFNIAENHLGNGELLIQPVAIAYTHIRRLPIDSTQWPKIAWYGDMVLLPHLWEFVQLGRVDVTLSFLPSVTLSQFGDRKLLAEHCHKEISYALDSARSLY